MNLDRYKIEPLTLLKIITVLASVIMGSYLVYFFPRESQGNLNVALLILVLVLYVAGVLMVTAENYRFGKKLEITGFALMAFSMVFMTLIQRHLLMLMFMGPFAGMLRGCSSLKISLLVTFGLHLVVAVVYELRWQSGAGWVYLPTTFIYSLTLIVLSHLLSKEAEANIKLADMHERLATTQKLLTDNAVDGERLRISRDLHDSLGHHLTALSMQLEIASHHAAGETVDPIQKSQSITKKLLSEVRDVVTNLRAESSIGLQKSLEHLVASTESTINLVVDENLTISSAELEETIYRVAQEIITNHTRHSHSGSLSICLSETENNWCLQVADQSNKQVYIKAGSGLSGMKERIEAQGGSFELSTDSGLSHSITFPKS